MASLDDLMAEFGVSDADTAAVLEGTRELMLEDMKRISDETGAYLLMNGDVITRVSFKGSEALTDDDVISVVEKTPNVQYCNLEKVNKITDLALVALGQHCGQLEELILNVCRKVTDNGMEAVVQFCPNLRVFSAVGCQKITDATINMLAAHCPNLIELNIALCHEVTEEALSALARACPNMEVYNLALVPHVTDELIEVIAEVNPNLRDLNIASCPQVTDFAIQYLADVDDSKLEVLNLSSIKNLTDEACRDIGNGLPALRDLNMQMCDGITQIGGEFIFKNRPDITKLAF